MVGRMDMVSPELVGILAVGAALAALVLRQGARLDRRIDLLTEHMNERFQRVDEQFQRVDEQLRGINEQLRHLGERVARLEGKVDLIEGFIARRNEPPGAAAE